MNAAVGQELRRWTPRRWIYSMLAVFLAQVALVWLLGARTQPRPITLHRSSSLQLLADPVPEERLVPSLGMSDPTAFALPGLHGFSGGAWMQFPRMEHRLREWSEPARWLPFSTQQLGQAFAVFVSRNVSAPLLIADKPLARRSGYEPAVPDESLPTQSTWRLHGELAGRRLLRPLELPSWPNTDLLSNTVVQVVVNAAGEVLTATLLEESGLRGADRRAVELAAGARFESMPAGSGPPSSRLTWGRFQFRWHTLAPPATNQGAGPL